MAEPAKSKADAANEDKARKKPPQVQPPALGFEAQPLWQNPQALAGSPMAVSPITTPPPPAVTAPAHSTNRAQRQASVVGMQHALGNDHVRRAIASRGRSLAPSPGSPAQAGALTEERRDDPEPIAPAALSFAGTAPPGDPKDRGLAIPRRRAEHRMVEPVRRKEGPPPAEESDEAPGIVEDTADTTDGDRIDRTVDSHLVQRDDGAGGGQGPTPPIDANTANQAKAQKILQNSFGKIRAIVAPTVVFMEEGALRTKHDEMQIRKKRNNLKTGQPWRTGDNATVFQSFEGFADQEMQTIYVLDLKGAGGAAADNQIVLLAHEMLHTNAASDWAGTVGGAIDEGATEILTQKAAAAAGIHGSAQYAGQMGLVQKIISAVGQGYLESAYFGSAVALTAAIDSVAGPGTWQKLHQAIGEHDSEKVDKLLDKDWNKKKVAEIQDALGGWVSDEDIERIKFLYGTLDDAGKSQARGVIEPAIPDLWSIPQRTQLRLLLAR